MFKNFTNRQLGGGFVVGKVVRIINEARECFLFSFFFGFFFLFFSF